MRYLIVTRHPAALAFVQALGPPWDTADVLTGNATADDVRDSTVVGNLPLHLAALTRCIYALEFSGSPPRGTEYTLAEMREAGAHLRAYTVEVGTTMRERRTQRRRDKAVADA